MKEETALQVQPGNLLEIISQLANSPNALDKIEVMERLLAMQERVQATQREAAFADAMTELQAEIPQISKHGRIEVKGQLRSKYALIEDLDVVLRPLCAKYGFSNSFDEIECTGDRRKYALTVTHRMGHAVTKYKEMPFDKSEFRSAVQSEGSTTSYAKRTLFKMAYNIVECAEDTDGNSMTTITEEQAKDIRTMIHDAGATEATFLEKIAYVDKIEDIPTKDWKRVTNALNTKIEAQRRAQK